VIRCQIASGALLTLVPLQRGEEMGWFQHGSTIIVLAPPGISLAEAVFEGARVQMGQPLLRIG
jgi:phosphatidylserine decarboxylase